MARAFPLGHAPRDILDALGRAYRRAAVFLDDQGHCQTHREKKAAILADFRSTRAHKPTGLQLFRAARSNPGVLAPPGTGKNRMSVRNLFVVGASAGGFNA